MGIWYIIGTRGSSTITLATVHDVEYHAEWMDDEYVTCSVKSPEPIDFRFGDRITYRGRTYWINYDPNVLKKARLGSYAEGFTYENIKLYSPAAGLKTVGFKDIVLEDNLIPYTMLGTFSFYASTVEDLADRIQANLNRENSGWRVLTPNYDRCVERVSDVSDWNSYYDGTEETGETEVNVKIDKQSCWDATKLAYTSFGLAWYVDEYTIVIGGKAISASHIFRYGKNKGLYEIERTSDENQEIVTKAFAYGSSQNVELGYYANKFKQAWLYYDNGTHGGTEHSISVPLEAVPAYNVLSSVYYDNGSNIRHGNIVVSCGGVEMDAYCELVKTSDGASFRLLACVEGYNPGSADVEYCNFTTQEILDRFKANLTGKVEVIILSGVNINRMSAERVRTLTGYPSTLSIQRLMLPGFPSQSLNDWVAENQPDLVGLYEFSNDPLDPWVKSLNAGEIGVWEGTASFDGSNLTEIYPTIENTDAGVVVIGSHITDNGYLDEDSDISFTIGVAKSDDLNWTDAIANASDAEGIYIEMKSGFCVGRKFKVKKCVDSTNRWTLTLEREFDNDLSRYFPYYEDSTSEYCQVRGSLDSQTSEGDTFVVTGIQMPDTYVEAAAEKLLIAACGWLDKRDHVRYTYLPKIDEIYMAREHDENGSSSLYNTLMAGMKLSFKDSDLGIDKSPFIDNLTIKENGNNGIPTYDVVLRDEKERGTLEAMAESISDLKSAQKVIERKTSTTEYVKEYKMGFFDASGYPYGDYVTARRNSVNVYILPKIYYGEDDITDEVDSWRWDRETKSGGKVEGWFTTQEVTITNEDMPSAWDYDNPAIFTCIATISSLDIEISKQFTI